MRFDQIQVRDDIKMGRKLGVVFVVNKQMIGNV
jgi:hypothetical protein